MPSNDTKGVCRFCRKSFSGRAMAKHLSTCKVKIEEDSKTQPLKKRADLIYHFKISGYKVFWLHIEIAGTKKLSHLDAFLRNIWLECCGHLSEFFINGERYQYTLPDQKDIFGGLFESSSMSMNIPIKNVLGEKDTFSYEYDFGSTTYLEGSVVSIREGYLKEPVRILARNNLPAFSCIGCEKTAEYICLECDGLYCNRCLKSHECGDEMTLPVVNSPRMGVCGYTGEYDFDTFQER